MEIKKADSKGRVSGFEPGEYYVIHRHIGHFHKVQNGYPSVDLNQLEDIMNGPVQGRAEEAEMLLNQAMAKKNGVVN